VKLRYVGTYKGVTVTGHNVSPGDIIEVTEEDAERLLLTGQFEHVVEEELPKGGE